MEIVLCFIAPIAMMITLMAVVVGFRMGKGDLSVVSIRHPKRRETEEKRKKDIIAGNIERYDGTSVGQREVK